MPNIRTEIPKSLNSLNPLKELIEKCWVANPEIRTHILNEYKYVTKKIMKFNEFN